MVTYTDGYNLYHSLLDVGPAFLEVARFSRVWKVESRTGNPLRCWLPVLLQSVWRMGFSVTAHLDLDNPAPYVDAAENLLARYKEFETEADVTSAVRDFLVVSGLATSGEIKEEHPPVAGSPAGWIWRFPIGPFSLR